MKIVGIKRVTPRRVYAIKTSTETFIADGLAHHNCIGCNMFGRGKLPEYELFMNTVYGKRVVEELWNKSRTIVQYKAHDYERIENEYKEKLKCLK